jgi:P-type Ca2+ transporter type 2C
LSYLSCENTPLQQQTGRLVKLFAFIGFGMCSALVLAYGLTRGDWLKGLLAGLTLGMAMLYIFVVHVPIAGLSLAPVLLGWPLMLLPIHIVFLELIIDPACTVVFKAEREESGIMARLPWNLSDSLFGARSLLVGLIQGGADLTIKLAFIFWALPIYGDQVTRAAIFTSMVLCNLGLILLSRAGKRSLKETLFTPNGPHAWVTIGSLGLLGLALIAPGLQNLFMFASIPPKVLGSSMIAAFASLAAANIARRWNVS